MSKTQLNDLWPSPAQLAAAEQATPGEAERILNEVESEMHRRLYRDAVAMERTASRWERGTVAAAVAGIALLAFAAWQFTIGHQIAGFVGFGIGMLIALGLCIAAQSALSRSPLAKHLSGEEAAELGAPRDQPSIARLQHINDLVLEGAGSASLAAISAIAFFRGSVIAGCLGVAGAVLLAVLFLKDRRRGTALPSPDTSAGSAAQ